MIRLIFILTFILTIPAAYAQENPQDVMGGHILADIGGQHYLLPTLKTDITADIQGDLTTVTVVQTFDNPFQQGVNARYLFPLNQHAAVYSMLMEVGNEKINALIREKEEAKKIFEHAKLEGKSAALLQQHRANMFTQDIANLMPGLPIKVTIQYVQTLPKLNGEYELVIPLVVGPRFQPAGHGEPPAAQGEPATANQWQLEALPAYPPVSGLHLPDVIDDDRVSLTIDLTSAIPIQRADSDTHAITIKRESKKAWHFSLHQGRTIDNKDFVIRFALAGKNNRAGLLNHYDDRGGFFSLLIEPPAQPVAEQISAREMVFVLDCSGSMSGLPMAASKAFMRHALNKLRASDSFRIVRFSEGATEFSSHPVSATPDNIRRGISYVNNLQGMGGTHMMAGIEQALKPSIPTGAIRLVTFLTDGYVGNEASIIKLINKKINGARLFALGVGAATNRYLLEEMAVAGKGFVRYMEPNEDTESLASSLAARLQSPVLTDIEIDWGDLDIANVSPQPIADLFAGESIRVQGRYKSTGVYDIKIKGNVNGRAATLPLRVDLTASDQTLANNGKAIALTWARSEITQLMRQLNTIPQSEADLLDNTHKSIQQRVTQLGLDFSLVTQWTSFVAVSEQVYNKKPELNTNQQIPLPQVANVAAAAYGTTVAPHSGPTGQAFAGHGAPEPELGLSLLIISGLFLGYLRRRKKAR